MDHFQRARTMFWRRQLQFPIPLLFLGCSSWPLAFASLLDARTLVETITERRIAGSRNLATFALPLEQKKDSLLRLLLERFVALSDEDLDQFFCSLIEPTAPIASALDLGQETDESIAVGGQSFCPLGAPPSHGAGRGLCLLVGPGDDGVAMVRFLPCLLAGLSAKFAPLLILRRWCWLG